MECALFFLTVITICISKSEDLCGLGGYGVGDALNGKWTYVNSNDTSYWLHRCSKISLRYASINPKLYFSMQHSSDEIVYGYCNKNVSDPYDCNGNWYLWNGSTFKQDSVYTLEYCSNYSSDQNNSTTNTNIAMYINNTESDHDNHNCSLFNEYDNLCLRSNSVNIAGSYSLKGCDRHGMPFWQLKGNNNRYAMIKFDWCVGHYFIINNDIYTKSMLYTHTYDCNTFDVLNCNEKNINISNGIHYNITVGQCVVMDLYNDSTNKSVDDTVSFGYKKDRINTATVVLAAYNTNKGTSLCKIYSESSSFIDQ